MKLKPIKLNKPPVINSEKPIFFGVKGKKSITLLTKNITKIVLILKSSCKKSITITYSTNYLYLVVLPQGVRAYLIAVVRPPWG